MKYVRKALGNFFRILPLQASERDMAGVSDRVQRAVPANFSAIALNGLCFPTAGRILGAGLVLTWFVSDLTPSAFWVGLIIPIQYGFALIAQPLVAQYLTTKSYRAPYYTAQSFLRCILWCALGFAAWTLGSARATLLLTIFFAVVIADATAAGIGNIAFNDTLARVIPQGLRGRARSWRGIFGSIAAGIAGLFIRKHLSENSGIAAFGTLFAIAGLLYGLGGIIFILIDEPPVPHAPGKKPTLGELIRKTRALLGRQPFRRFVMVQSLLVPIAQALPFFMIFVRRSFNIEVEALGLLIIVDAGTPLIGNFVWGRLADARGNRWIIICASVCGLLAPACSFWLYAALSGELSRAFMLALLTLIVFAIGMTSVGIDLATKNYVLDLAPDDRQRPMYIGVNDMLVGLPTMLMAGAGVIIDASGFLPVFVGLVVLTVTGALLAAGLPPLRRKAAR
jgi:MFS family permease